MTMPQPSNTSVIDTKRAFLQSQIRLLSNPLQTPNTGTEPTTSIPAKTTEDILTKVNAKIKSHNRLVFSAPSQRHVAEQIDVLYWNEVVADTKTRERDTVWVSRDVDLCETGVVDGLPASLEELGVGDEEQRVRYADVKARVEGLVKRKEDIRQKVEGYRALRKLLAPFEDVKRDVQPNLVTRDGELARELERTRVLIARVEGGIGEGEIQRRDGNEQSEDALDDRQKLAQVLELG